MKALKLEITAKNALNKFCKDALAKVLPQLTPFVGKKVFLADGSKAKNFIIDTAVEPEKIEGMNVEPTHCYLTAEYDRIELRVKLCLNGGSYEAKPVSTAFTKYIDCNIKVGTCKDGQILESVVNIFNIIKSHGFDEVVDFDDELVKIKEYKALLKKAEAAKDKIKVAGEYYKYID